MAKVMSDQIFDRLENTAIVFRNRSRVGVSTRDREQLPVAQGFWPKLLEGDHCNCENRNQEVFSRHS